MPRRNAPDADLSFESGLTAVDWSGLAERALGEDKSAEIAHFTAGMRGQTEEALSLGRGDYTALQKAVEEAAVRVADGQRLRYTPIIYLTPKPSTPTWNAEHPRHELVQDMLAPTRKPLALFICSEAGLWQFAEEASPAARQALVDLVVAQNTAPHTVFSYHTEKEAGGSFMTLCSTGSKVRVGFFAEQMPSTGHGEVRFGTSVVTEFMRAQGLHINATRSPKPRAHKAILEILEGKR